jgi:predicted transcriptional regulator
MGQEMEMMHKMLQNVHQSVEVQDMERKNFEATIKAFDAETKRLAAVQASMSPEQIQDIVMGTVHGMITSGDLAGEIPGQELPGEGMPMEMPPEMPPEMPMQEMPPQGMPQ